VWVVPSLHTRRSYIPISCCTKLKSTILPSIWDGISTCFTFTLMSMHLADGRLIMPATYPGGWQASRWKGRVRYARDHKRHASLPESGHGGIARAAHADVSCLRGYYRRIGLSPDLSSLRNEVIANLRLQMIAKEILAQLRAAGISPASIC